MERERRPLLPPPGASLAMEIAGEEPDRGVPPKESEKMERRGLKGIKAEREGDKRFVDTSCSSPHHGFEQWMAQIRHRNRKQSSGFSTQTENPTIVLSSDTASCSAEQTESRRIDCARDGKNCVVPETSLRDRLLKAGMADIEADDFNWNTLWSLHHLKQSSREEITDDDPNRALEVTVNSGGIVFIALFKTSESDGPKEAAAAIKIAPSRMATQSERLGYEFARWLGVRTPQARVVHNSSPEWQHIKDAAGKAKLIAATSNDGLAEMAATELLEALELSRCLFVMNYIHGLPLLDDYTVFEQREAAERTAEALGRVFMLDMILRNEDRLRCRQLGWRGNYANLLVADKETSANLDALDETYESAALKYKPEMARKPQKERRAISDCGRAYPKNHESTSKSSDDSSAIIPKPGNKEKVKNAGQSDFLIVAIDSGVPRKPPAGKRVKDQDSYPRLVELTLNDRKYSSNLLYEISSGRLGFPGPEEVEPSYDPSPLSETDMVAVVNAFRIGFRAALRDLEGFQIFLIALFQKLDGLHKAFLAIMDKSDSDRDDYGTSDTPISGANAAFSFPTCKEAGGTESEPSDVEPPRQIRRSSRASSRESIDLSSPMCRDSLNGRCYRGNGEFSRNMRLTSKLRDFYKFAKGDAELSKELEQWNEMLRDATQFCQDNLFSPGFFESTDHLAVDTYELKIRLEHILERIALISDAASTERPSQITEALYIGGALAARSMHTLQYLGITHVLCLCSNEIGQSESQFPCLFDYRNFSISDDEDEDISEVFQEACDFIEYAEYLKGKVLVHCFEGRSRSSTVVLAYFMLRKNLTLLEAWNMLKKAHRRAQPNEGFVKILLDLDRKLHGKASMEWQQKRPAVKLCPICGEGTGLSSSILKLHLEKAHPKISSGSVDSGMSLEIKKALDALKTIAGGTEE